MARSLETPLFTNGASARKPGGLPARTIELVQASWASVLPIADVAATLFYDRLFELDPSLRALFKSDLGEQKKKLMLTLGVAVDGLRTPAKLVPVLQTLGVRHAGYMVVERHYATVGEALIWTLREGLGEAFTPEVEAAWAEVYRFVSTVMKQAAADAKRPAPPRGIVVPPAAGAHVEIELPAVETVPLGGRTLPGGAEVATRDASGVGPRTVELVQATWARILPIADAAAALFYDRLFELDPSLRALFKSDLGEQKKKAMLTLGVAVDGLRNPGRLSPVLRALGARHVGYRVTERHYDTVGEALIWTLREGLGASFTPEVESAWREVYAMIAAEMKQGAAEHQVAPPTPHGVNGAARPVKASPPPESTPAPAPAALRVPIGPQEVTLHVLVKLDTPPLVQVHAPPVQVPAPRAPAPEPAPAIGVGPLAALLCAASAAGTALLLAALDRSLAAPALYGAPIAVTVLLLSAFAAGHLAGRSRSPTAGP
jgi:hemoglobin-like flavoprotein